MNSAFVGYEELSRSQDLKPQLAGGNQLAIHKRGRGFELGTTKNKSSKWPEQDLNPGPPDCESHALTTQPRCLLSVPESLLASLPLQHYVVGTCLYVPLKGDKVPQF